VAHSSRSTAQMSRNASETLNQIADQVGGAIKNVAGQAYAATTQRADAVTANLGGQLSELGDRVHANSPDGYLHCASEAVANNMKRGGDYLQTAKVSGIADDLANLIKRNPVQAALIALGVCWFVSRRR